ncbi:DUF6047 family protein [Bacteroides intestinalis]|jgi:hypothetical protein|uniref:DUF6047 family protein n=1 Tax=Bacteroides intestinalis TaxID=329854 RepID=UPI000E4BA781|nr:DUF6047 family protein [Bacteroides intestinalis]RGX86965.1 hypothetical protein DXA61_05910 [Bacteroides intestinalis]
MFRFDFRDKSLIPGIFGTDNMDYLERLCPVLEQERIHPSGVVRLRDAAFCEERGIVQLSSLAEHTALKENEDYKRLGHRFGMDGDVIRNGLAAFPTCTAVEYGQKVLLLGKTDKGDKALEDFLNDLTRHFFDGIRKPEELRFHEVAPLDAKYRAEIGNCKTVSPAILRYGICTKRCDMAPTLRNFNRLRNLQPMSAPLTKEQERIVSSLVGLPDNVQFQNVEMKVRTPAKRKGQGINI